ncbi:helix-turn-helix transcriptional regulator [Escherichia coli]|uniref:helix-turn-helix transcriptional regulator n=1 Tax=Escherichia coli TaxID=562 RepID=UPI000B7EAE0B|nr:AraC family transcriptional regulator [Escherichia coli]
MSLVKIRTNKFSILFTGDNDIYLTVLSKNQRILCKKNTVIMVSRNLNIGISSENIPMLLRNAIHFDHKTIMIIKKILMLTYNFNHSTPLNLSEYLESSDGIININYNINVKELYKDIKDTSRTYDCILAFLMLCKKLKIEEKVFPLIFFSAATTFCNKVIDIIESDISRKWTLPLLAEKCNLTEVAIRKKLEIEGFFFKSLLFEIRMKKAITYLVEGKKSISQIANILGYKNTSYFISSFRMFFGMTPKQLQLSLIRKGN